MFFDEGGAASLASVTTTALSLSLSLSNLRAVLQANGSLRDGWQHLIPGHAS